MDPTALSRVTPQKPHRPQRSLCHLGSGDVPGGPVTSEPGTVQIIRVLMVGTATAPNWT